MKKGGGKEGKKRRTIFARKLNDLPPRSESADSRVPYCRIVIISALLGSRGVGGGGEKRGGKTEENGSRIFRHL